MKLLKKLKSKYYFKLKKQYPDADHVYQMYRQYNLDHYNKHKLKSWFFFYKLVCASKRNKNLKNISFPKNTYNPFLTHLSISDKNSEFDQNCLAIPDSKLLKRKSPEELVSELLKYDVISFDIFDTCIFRPFEKPIDLFYLLEAQNGIINFSSLRIDAESSARQKTNKPNFEVDIYDIYEDLSTRCFLTKNDAEREIGLEKKVCYANPYMLEVFNLLKKKKKTIIAISDMYLPSSVIKDILDKNGFVGFDKIFVSNEYGFSKSCGKLFEIAKEKYGKSKTYAHIGDNHSADVIGAQRAGFESFYYQQCNQFGNTFRPKSLYSPVSSIYKGIVNNHLYNGLTSNTARQDFAFLYAGPIVSGYCEWINTYSKTYDIDKILFMARDMDIFYKVYNKHYKEYDNEYVTTSRFSLQECLVKDFTDEFLFHTVDSRAERGYTITQTFSELGLTFLLPKISQFGLHENSFVLRSNLNKIHKLIKTNLEEVAEHFKDNETAAKMYFKEKIGKAKRLLIVDLGWRGSILAYLKYLLVDKWKLCEEVKGVLLGMSNSTTSQNLISRGIVDSFVYNYCKNRDYLRCGNWELDYITMISLECIFTSEENSLVEYRLNKDKNKVEFLTYENNPNKEIIREFHTGIMKFVDEFEKFRKPYRQYYPITAIDAFEPMNLIVNNFDYISRIIGDFKDTPYQFAGLGIKLDRYVTLGELMLERNLIKKWPLE